MLSAMAQGPDVPRRGSNNVDHGMVRCEAVPFFVSLFFAELERST